MQSDLPAFHATLKSCREGKRLKLFILVNLQEAYSLSSVLTFYFSWSVVIGNSRLPQEKRSLIRKYLQQVLPCIRFYK